MLAVGDDSTAVMREERPPVPVALTGRNVDVREAFLHVATVASYSATVASCRASRVELPELRVADRDGLEVCEPRARITLLERCEAVLEILLK